MLTPYEIFWLFVFPATLFSWYHMAKNVISFIKPKRDLPSNPYPKIIFQIAARKLNLTVNPVIKKSVDSINKSCAEVGFTNYQVKLVVDNIEMGIDGVETVLVPKGYNCRSKFKARALNYALMHLPDSKDTWILHLDEDANVTTQCVSSIIRYIKNGGNPIANGPSIFPYDGNVLTFYAEAQRQWTFYWLMDQERTSIIHWLNGSNLLVRSDIEHIVGWDFPNCFISEDARFGYEATIKLGKVFGWHGGLTIETPPVSLKALMKQRMRWFFGSILNLRYVPKQRLPRRIYTIAVWLCGFILTLFFFVMLVGLYHEPWFSSLPIASAFTGTGIFWLARYQVGVYQNLKQSTVSKKRKALLHIGILFLAPVIDLLCTIPAIMALIRPPKSFEITEKRRQKETSPNVA